MTPRVAFLIDGFNLYHSVEKAGADLHGAPTKWLNVRGLCDDYLSRVGGGAQTHSVHYFSAIARHMEAHKPDVTARHRLFIEAISSTGVQIELGRFKKKRIVCDACGTSLKRHEEKETDVAIAVKMLELCHTGAADALVLMTGDTDIAPAVRSVQRLFPGVPVLFAFPYGRENRELTALAPGSFAISKDQYVRHQFPTPLVLPSGRTLTKPASW